MEPAKVNILQETIRTSLGALQHLIRSYSAVTGFGGGFLLDECRVTPRQNLLKDARLVTNRYELLTQLPKGGRVGEIGTLHGAFAQKIIEICQPAEYHIFDISFDNLSDAARDAFTNHGEVHLHLGKSWENLRSFPDNHFDWLYIDGDHTFEGVRRDASEAVRCVRPGGLIIFNDYMNWSPIQMCAYGVQAAANAIINQHNLEVVYFAFEARGYNDLAVRIPE